MSAYSRRQYGGPVRRVGNPPTRLPGAAYNSTRRGRGAPSSYKPASANNPLSIQPRSTKRTTKTNTHTNKKNSAVRTSGTTTTSHRNHNVRKNNTAATSSRRTTSSSNRTTAAPRSSQHRANKNSSLQVGQYLVGKTIGQGTFGKVKLGVHCGTGEKVAIKILEKKKIVEVADVERVSREILILKRVGAVHDNVIRLYEVIDTPKAIYLIMEYCSGGELFDFIVKQGKIKEKQACNFFHQILNGCEYLHKCNIVHRDLKPENLLMNRRPEGWNVKVVDFGLSNTDDGGKLLKTACGSPCYAAPEMIAGKKYVGPKADMWSLGVVLFALVCGFLPFEHDNTSELYKKILKGDYKCPKFVSPQVRDLLSKILNTNPKHRYSIAQVRKHPWMKMVKVKNVQHASTPPRRGMPGKHLTNGSSNGGNGTGKHATRTSGTSGSPGSGNGGAGNILANIDQQVLRQCADLGFKPALVVEGLVNKLENQATQAYSLLSRRKMKLAEAQALKNGTIANKIQKSSPTKKNITTKVPAAIPPFKKKTTTTKATSSVAGTVGASTATTATTGTPGTSVPIQTDTKVTTGTVQQPAGEPSGGLSTPINSISNSTTTTTTVVAPTAPPPTSVATANTTTNTSRGGRRVVAAANQNRNELPQQPHRPSAPPSKKAVVEKQALQAVSLAPMGEEETAIVSNPTEIGTATKTTNNSNNSTSSSTATTSTAIAFATPRLDEQGNVIAVVPTRPPNDLIHPQSARNADVVNDATMQNNRPSVPLTARTSPSRPLTTKNVNGVMNSMEIIKGAFNVAHTSSKSPMDLILEIKRVLQQSSIPFSMSNEYQMTCHKQNTRFKVEICKLDNVEKVCLVRCVRLAGDAWAAKQIAKTIMGKIRL